MSFWPFSMSWIKEEKYEKTKRAADMKFFLLVGNRPAAIKRVAELTGAGLRMSKDFVDRLQ